MTGAAALTGCSRRVATRPPNVLFIMADDLRPELGCYGSVAVTPCLDALARRGMIFRKAYCQQAVCNPSRSSMLTGLRPDTLGLYVNGTHFRELKPTVNTLPGWMKEHGYTTRCVGKIFHNWHTKEHGDPRSWSAPEFLHYANHGDDVPQASGPLPPNLATLSSTLRQYGKVPLCECRDVPDEAYYDGRVAAEAVRVLGEIKNEPFFLAVGFWKPHAPFNAPQKYWDMYPAGTIKLPDNYQPSPDVPAPALHNWYELRTYGDVPSAGGIPDEMALNLIRGYRACTSFVDAQIGRVLDELDRLGLRESTIVVLLGDHGYHLGENGIFTKMTNFELCTHAPLIVSAPGQKPGQRTRALVEFVDIYPTLAELCGLKLPSHLEGTSFAPLLADPEQKGKRAAFSQYLRTGKEKFMGRSVRTDRWRYTEWTNMKDELVGTELYDERTDPKENHNLAKDPANAETVAAMAKQLHEGPKGLR